MTVTGIRLRYLREKNKLTQKEIAECIGVTRAAYNKYECGVSKPIRKLKELAELFQVSTDYILGQDETTFEKDLNNISDNEYKQIQKYLRLSKDNQDVVNCIIDALLKKEGK